MFLLVSVILSTGGILGAGGPLGRVSVQVVSGGLCAGALSRGVSVERALSTGVQWGICPVGVSVQWGSLSSGGLCPVGVSVQWGSLSSGGLCLGSLCPGSPSPRILLECTLIYYFVHLCIRITTHG